MSLEILLIPMALAAVNAWQARAAGSAEQGRQVVQTRLRDTGLLTTSIRNLGGTAATDGGEVRAQLDGATLHFGVNSDGLAVAHIAGVAPATAESLISRVDAEYAMQVQTQVYDRLMARADELGLTVESEQVQDDNTIIVTLLTNRHMPA